MTGELDIGASDSHRTKAGRKENLCRPPSSFRVRAERSFPEHRSSRGVRVQGQAVLRCSGSWLYSQF